MGTIRRISTAGRSHNPWWIFSKMMIRNLIFVSWLAVATISAQMTAQQGKNAFRAGDYPSGKFKVTQKRFTHGTVTIQVIQVKNLGYTMEPDTCRAWLDVRKGNQLLKRVYYRDFEPVGGSFGLFLPKHQPSADYFVAVKEGDYDGRLLLVSKDGVTHDLLGGMFFLTEDRRYLVSEYMSDLYALAVFDLQENKVVLESRNLPEIGSWYKDDAGYFFMEYGRPDHAERLDLQRGQLVKILVSRADRSKARKVTYDFDDRKKRDCTSDVQCAP